MKHRRVNDETINIINSKIIAQIYIITYFIVPEDNNKNMCRKQRYYTEYHNYISLNSRLYIITRASWRVVKYTRNENIKSSYINTCLFFLAVCDFVVLFFPVI